MGTEIVTVKALSATTTRATARNHSFTIDKPTEKGGTDEAPMASEYLLAALGSCQITTAHRVAAKRGLTIDDITVTVTGEFSDGKMQSVHVDFAPTGPGEQRDWETLMKLTDRVCTISQALGVPMTHALAWTPTQSA